jgi:hypothetical protein
MAMAFDSSKNTQDQENTQKELRKGGERRARPHYTVIAEDAV